MITYLTLILQHNSKKEYCSYWIRHGECDYQQQGTSTYKLFDLFPTDTQSGRLPLQA